MLKSTYAYGYSVFNYQLCNKFISKFVNIDDAICADKLGTKMTNLWYTQWD